MVIWPEFISLRDWSSALISDYHYEHLPLLDIEESWQEWGALVSSTGLFERAGVPSPINEEEPSEVMDWTEWAKTVFKIVWEEEFQTILAHRD